LCRFLFNATLVATMLASAPARGDENSTPAPPPAPATTDAGDLWRRVRHAAPPGDDQQQPSAAVESRKPFFVVAPSIGSKPSTGVNGGVAGNIAFVDGDPRTTHISSMSGGVKVSQMGQTLSGLKLAMFTPDDHWFIQGDNRLSWTSQNTYGLGGNTTSATAENLKYDQLRVYETAYHAVAAGLFVGAGININRHTNIGPGSGDPSTFDEDAYVAYSQAHGFNIDHQTSSGTSVSLLFDTRDNAINARRGWFANVTYRTFFSGFLGGDSTWQEASVDVRTYRALTADGRHELAFWFLGDFVTGGTPPYLDLPATAGDAYGRSARGYGEGRYRGNQLMYGEVEYRQTLTRNGLLGFVTFLNTTTIDSDAPADHLFDTLAPGAGLGLRFLLNKKSRTNLCVDYGWGKDGSRGLYLAIQEAF
ncbi:MAG TPA: BamA/TamA family outer membrane protein, partial [Vicinamibacterales bacterium]|nr:BamA/TamA family outer membrane protein [Vicinamibacterales bacterium]